MTQNTHYHSKRGESGHSEKIMDQRLKHSRANIKSCSLASGATGVIWHCYFLSAVLFSKYFMALASPPSWGYPIPCRLHFYNLRQCTFGGHVALLGCLCRDCPANPFPGHTGFYFQSSLGYSFADNAYLSWQWIFSEPKIYHSVLPWILVLLMNDLMLCLTFMLQYFKLRSVRWHFPCTSFS